MPNTKGQRFWNKIARRYAARPIKDTAAYQALLADAASRLRPTDRVLEIGCGTGGTAIALAPAVAHLTATDFSAEMIAIALEKPAPANLRFVVRDAATAFDGGPYDAICAFNVLHLIDDLPATLSAIHQNLPPGGLFLSKSWCFADLGWRLRALFVGLRLFGMFPPAASLSRAQLDLAITAAGFEIVETRIFGTRAENPYIVARKASAA